MKSTITFAARVTMEFDSSGAITKVWALVPAGTPDHPDLVPEQLLDATFRPQKMLPSAPQTLRELLEHIGEQTWPDAEWVCTRNAAGWRRWAVI